MKIALASDWHIGITKEKSIRAQLKEMVAKAPDVIVMLGDFCGGTVGYRSVRTITRLTREYFPDKPLVYCLGNHDYWVEGRKLKVSGMDLHDTKQSRKTGYPSMRTFILNYDKIVEVLKENKVHFLDEDGPYRHPDHYGIVLVGHTMWYRNPPRSNDQNYLPFAVEGDTHRWMYKRSMDKALEHLDKLTDEDITRVFCSHFPLVGINENNSGDLEWAGDWKFGEFIQANYKIEKFFNGHAHQLHKGPLRYEAGSDYWNPKFIIIDL